jgi:peptide deformylase
MSIKEILQLGNPILWEKSSPITEINSKTKELILDLRDTLANFRNSAGFGRAIAAPQIGILQQMIFVNTPAFCGPLINPVIKYTSPEQMELWDDCFSFPELMVRVSRSIKINIDYQNEKGVKLNLTAENDFSELLQHEIDHLHGILAVERAISPKAFATKHYYSQALQSNK